MGRLGNDLLAGRDLGRVDLELVGVEGNGRGVVDDI
jgi:hypothetical protein